MTYRVAAVVLITAVTKATAINNHWEKNSYTTHIINVSCEMVSCWKRKKILKGFICNTIKTFAECFRIGF